MIKNVTLAFFSGTGCTKAVVDCFEKQFGERGIDTTLIDIAFDNESSAKVLNATDLLIVFSPVYAFRLADIVEEWIKKLPDSAATPAAIISVSGGGEVSPNTACRLTSKRLLKRKNYHVIYEKMIVMPSNFAVPTQDHLAMDLIRILPSKVKRIITDLLSGRENLTSPKGQDRVFAALGRLEHVGAKLFGASIHATQDCNLCRLCIRNCPKKNITLQDGRMKFGLQCMFCMRCIYDCPQKALSPRIMKFVVIKDGFSLSKLRELASQPQEQENYEPPKNELWNGVIEYLREDRALSSANKPEEP